MILKTQDKYSQNLLVFDFASTDREKERKNLMIEKSNTAIPVAEKQTTSSQIRFITITAMFIALTYVFTAFVNIKLPIAANGGLIHLGNVPLFIGAILFGKKTGAIAGGVGMGLFDLLSGWTAWAPFTLVIVGLMGFAVGAITEKRKGFGWNVLYLWKLGRSCCFYSGKSGSDWRCSRYRFTGNRTSSETRKIKNSKMTADWRSFLVY